MKNNEKLIRKNFDSHEAENINNELVVRRQKLEQIKKSGIQPYPDTYSRTHMLSDASGEKEGTKVSVCGRMLTRRTMGKITFCHLLDGSGKMQIVLREEDLGSKDYETFHSLLDTGDFMGVTGEIFVTKKGEVSVLVKQYIFLGKALRPLPEKWHGLKNQEQRYRKRYLDLISNPETKDFFVFKSRLIQSIRSFYHSEKFIELETPVLANTASGALAKPFMTHHNALDIDVYLRISAGELWQKMAIVGSFEKTFEIARVFRNEGMDPSHLQEFTMVEHYAAYWNFKDNMAFTEKMFSYFLKELFGTMKVEIKDRDGDVSTVDFTPPWPRVSFREIIIKDSGIDITKYRDEKELLEEIKKKKFYTEEMDSLGLGNLIDELYKTVSRSKIVAPTFLVEHPIEISPLARKNDENPKIVDRFQLIVKGWEVVNAYSELVDPVDQKGRFSKQVNAKKMGDDEAHGEDDEFVEALEYGAPPMSGWGMGIDRLAALLTKHENLRDVVLFPLLKPLDKAQSKNDTEKI